MRRSILFSLGLFGCGILLATHGAAAATRSAGAALRMNSAAEGTRRLQRDTRVRSCAETGLCARGKQRFLLGSQAPRDVYAALLQGCRSKRWLKNDVVVECPENVTIRGAAPERVFQTLDLFSAEQIGATGVQQKSFVGGGVRVAILDTGIDAGHPEVAGRVVAQASFVDGAASAADGHGHGTHVAGIVAGQGNGTYADDNGNNRILGIAPQVDLLIGKVCTDQGWCPEGSILAGIEWAVSNGARVINLSLGGGAFMSHCDADALAAKVNWAGNQGVVVIAASGNGGAQTAGVSTPGCASLGIAVGAVDRSDARQTWSGYGPPLDVMAPGLGILSSLPCSVAGTCPEAGRGWWSGTSMAAPHVAGLAALLRGVNPSLTANEVRAALVQSARDGGAAGFDDLYGFGRVDASAAVARAQDVDGDGSPIPLDCMDRNAAVSPLASERCGNGLDDDCDGQMDEGCSVSSSPSSPRSSAQGDAAASRASSTSSVSSAPSSRSSSASFSSPRSSVSSAMRREDENREREREREREEEERDEERSSQSEGARDEDRNVCRWWEFFFSNPACVTPPPRGWEQGNRPMPAPPGQSNVPGQNKPAENKENGRNGQRSP